MDVAALKSSRSAYKWLLSRKPRALATLGPMVAWLQAFVVRVSRLLSEHRLASFAVTAVILLLTADSIRRVLSDEDEWGGVLMWALLAVAAYSAIATVFWLRRGPPESRLFIAWFSGITPACAAWPPSPGTCPRDVGRCLARGCDCWLGRRGHQNRLPLTGPNTAPLVRDYSSSPSADNASRRPS